MTDILLRLKSWQLFLLLLLSYFLPSGYVFERVANLLFIGIYLGWIYSVGFVMHSLLPDKRKPGITYFKISCLFIIVLFITLSFTGGYTINQDNYKEYGNSIWFLVPLILYTIWSMLYMFMFAAQMLESMIEGRLVLRSDSLKGFFGFWFFPFGVWYIQPAVQRVLDAYAVDKVMKS